MKNRLTTGALTVAATLLTASVAVAHPGHAGDGGFADGLWHPVLGLDHLLAVVAVGLLAARKGGAAVLLVPGAFLASMLAGGLIAAAGVGLPGVEASIAVSVVVLGAVLATGWNAPLRTGLPLVALFAAYHGYAHAAEMAAGTSLPAYAGGFLLATALLHAIGVVVGLTLVRRAERGLRWAGGAIVAAGLLLAAGMV
jgi:urease accessory protein